ncbi:peptide-methionine (S)-S-oxide reductase MsrA [Rhabdochromatium marinum]|uniref:peptide-methionine (S)-S-oxide reductase MsrA n=1 Tax=Rhabdochromatium marinum TaxID=48729 RepID=UPI0019082C46|nr:peptide-methionine (S)-S-oxide reductase MsrA [Rhabdochromatium marinum]MBK1648238.1 peptide methionine sulfoxide reductase [Rhabdochromatium marinum]
MTNNHRTEPPPGRLGKGLASRVMALISAFGLGSLLLASGQSLAQPLNPDQERIVLGMGCFWGAEKRMSELPGVTDVVSGYAGGERPNPGYQQILRDERRGQLRNHAEVVQVSFNPGKTSLEAILIGFWENHDPTQGNRQGNDRGSNYRSAIYFNSAAQEAVARRTKAIYQDALSAAGYGAITTEIAPLNTFYPAEAQHQDYLQKNPKGYCGLGGTGVKYPDTLASASTPTHSPPADAERKPLVGSELSTTRQLIAFEAPDCGYCVLFNQEILAHWSAPVPVRRTLSTQPPTDWVLSEPLWATPTIVLFEQGKESARYTGYTGDADRFWRWLAKQTLSPEAFEIAYGKGTEAPYSGSLLDNHRPGTYVDPVTGAPLFRSDAKFKSGTGWPSFFQPIAGAVTMHQDLSHGMSRTEVRSASSGIHLGHVFNDGPAPSGKRYCINSAVLRFIPDPQAL